MNEIKESKGNDSKGLAIASLVLGIVGLLLNFCLGVLGIIFAIIGLILGIIAIVKKQGGMAIAGTVLSTIALLVTLFWMFSIGEAANKTNKQAPVNTNKPVITETNKTAKTETPATTVKEEQGKNETTGQKNAVKKAKSYLNHSSFSYTGLIKQLEYEGFSNEEAIYAVDNCDADWNEQAAKKAKSYLKHSSFSKQGLIDQLEFEGFTSEQASYGASENGY